MLPALSSRLTSGGATEGLQGLADVELGFNGAAGVLVTSGGLLTMLFTGAALATLTGCK